MGTVRSLLGIGAGVDGYAKMEESVPHRKMTQEQQRVCSKLIQSRDGGAKEAGGKELAASGISSSPDFEITAKLQTRSSH